MAAPGPLAVVGIALKKEKRRGPAKQGAWTTGAPDSRTDRLVHPDHDAGAAPLAANVMPHQLVAAAASPPAHSLRAAAQPNPNPNPPSHRFPCSQEEAHQRQAGGCGSGGWHQPAVHRQGAAAGGAGAVCRNPAESPQARCVRVRSYCTRLCAVAVKRAVVLWAVRRRWSARNWAPCEQLRNGVEADGMRPGRNAAGTWHGISAGLHPASQNGSGSWRHMQRHTLKPGCLTCRQPRTRCATAAPWCRS